MHTRWLAAALVTGIAFIDTGCTEVNLKVNGQGFASLQVTKGQKLTWTAEHPLDKVQIDFSTLNGKHLCKEYSTNPFPSTPAHSVTCTVTSEFETSQDVSYKIILVEGSGSPTATTARVVDCHYCDVNVGHNPPGGSTPPPPPPTGNPPTPTRSQTPSTSPSGIHFVCDAGKPDLSTNYITEIAPGDLTPSTARTWIPDGTATSWSVAFEKQLCEEGAQITSTDPVKFRCTITKNGSGPTPGDYLYNLAASGCGSSQPSLGIIRITQ